jgi:putative Ca2+/H+ antiporter (TMEM165/GDT1 family)
MLELPRRHLVGVAVMFMLLLQLLMVVVANIGFDIKIVSFLYNNNIIQITLFDPLIVGTMVKRVHTGWMGMVLIFFFDVSTISMHQHCSGE